MFISNLNRKRPSRKFTFTPYYYQPLDNEEAEKQGRARIRFKKIRRHQIASQKSVRIKIVFAILLVLFLYFFQGLIQGERDSFEIEDVTIDESPITLP